MFVKFCFRGIFDESRHPLSGRFDAQCQESYAPSSLKALVTMVLRGANVDNVKNPYFNQTALTVLQLMIFNSTAQTRKASSQAFHYQTRASNSCLSWVVVAFTNKEAGFGLEDVSSWS